MERKVTKLEHAHVEIIVTVDEKTWKDAQEKAFNKLAKNVTVSGFRKGKAPLNLVRGKVDPMKIMDEAINAVLPVAYAEAIREEKIEPFAQPKVDVTKLSETELELKYVVAVRPEVKLGAYKGLKVGKGEVKVSNKEVEESIKELLSNNATMVVKEDAAALGDTVVMDFVGMLDGKPFDGGSSENYELVLGSNSFIPGFEDALVGHKAGEEFSIDVTFPENYTEELKGKPAVFKIKLHEVKEKKLPELTEETIKELNIEGVTTEAELKKHQKEAIATRKANDARRSYMNLLLDEIVKGSEVEIPEEIVEAQVQHTLEDMANRMAQSGLTMEQYLSIVGQTQEQLESQVRFNAQREANHFFTLSAIKDAEKITATDLEVEQEYANLAVQYKMELDQVKKALESRKGEFENQIAMRKVEDFLYENND